MSYRTTLQYDEKTQVMFRWDEYDLNENQTYTLLSDLAVLQWNALGDRENIVDDLDPSELETFKKFCLENAESKYSPAVWSHDEAANIDFSNTTDGDRL